MDTATTLEREVKLSFDSAEAARETILAAGAIPLHGRRLQEDALLDNAADMLRQRACCLRIRMEGGKSRITFKGPVQPSTMKLRDEFETLVGDGVLLLRIFEELGFHVWFRYEKYREEFAAEGVTIAVDETPVGVFVEIEGSEKGITAMAAAMGRGPKDYILDSYRSLFLQRRGALGLTGAHMLFPQPE
jgi:adenylate cyclase class 2